MRLMILKSPGGGADGLARKTAETIGINLVELTTETIPEWDHLLAQALEQPGRDEGFVLLVELRSSDQATELESILERRDRPLELVIGIDTLTHAASVESQSAYTALCDYFHERGLLRKIRGEGSLTYLVATISRMVEDMRRSCQLAADCLTAVGDMIGPGAYRRIDGLLEAGAPAAEVRAAADEIRHRVRRLAPRPIRLARPRSSPPG